MRIPKWLRRDRSNRRCSDSQAMMFNDSSSTRLDNFEDPIRTEEYKKHLAEFLARRSLGPIEEDFSRNNPHNKTHGKLKKDEANKLQPERKSKRFSLPDTRHNREFDFSSSDAPQFQFSFSNQLYVSNDSKKKKKHQKRNESVTSTSPDLLPPRFMRTKHVDFDECDNPSSPPHDFFKDCSLPYADRDTSALFNESKHNRKNVSHISFSKKQTSPKSNERTHNNIDAKNVSLSNDIPPRKPKDLEKSIETNLDESCELDTTDASFGSVVRKLEQKCQIVKTPNIKYFRGVPLVRMDSLKFSETVDVDLVGDKRMIWNCATWNNVPVLVKKYIKQKKSTEKDLSFSQYIFTDIDILTKIRHSNILLLMSICYERHSNIFTVFEESIGSLYDYIHTQGNKLTYERIITYLSGISNALVYLNANKYVHTSVSSHSIILTSQSVAKLCNFELCSPIITNQNNASNEEHLNVHSIYKLNYSSEPEYENIKEFDKISLEDEIESDTYSQHECSPQDTSVRKLFSYYRWQAPELFNDLEGLVYPCSGTDVYSLCLVIWECFNNSAPWKTLSYKQLANLYVNLNMGIKLHAKELYPDIIFEMLSEGLRVKSTDRITINELHKKFTDAMNAIHQEGQYAELTAKIPNSDTEEHIQINYDQIPEEEEEEELEDEIEQEENSKFTVNKTHPITFTTKNIRKYLVTNLDEDSNYNNTSDEQYSHGEFFTEMKAHSVNLSSFGMSSKSLDTESFAIGNCYSNTFQNTDSTEYCSLLTPDIKRYTSRTSNLDSMNHTSKLSFNEESISDREVSLSDRIKKLNTSLTPKSYKSLQIEQPSAATIDNIRNLTDSFERRNNLNKSTYSFDIQNTSLPATPIARNNKLKKNAWLSGKTNDVQSDSGNNKLESFKNGEEINKSSLQIHNPSNSISEVPNSNFKAFSHIDTQTETHLPEQDSFKSSMSLNADGFLQRCIGTTTDGISGESNYLNFKTFRRRSHSLNSKPSIVLKSHENVTGVDIKPIVAIHEKWIMEARKKQGRSYSLPDNYRGLYAVKPASHLTDPARPKYGVLSPNINDGKHDKMIHTGCYLDISPLVRPAVTKKRILNANPTDFFENSLWRKEKEKCISQMKTFNDPPNSSTPKTKNSFPELNIQHAIDKSTNTESIDELYNKIISDIHKNNLDKTINIYERSRSECVSIKNFEKHVPLNDSALKNAKSSVIAELTNTFERITKSNLKENKPYSKEILRTQRDKENKDKFLDITITINSKPNNASQNEFEGVSVSEKRRLFDETLNNDDLVSGEYYHGADIEEDSISLPDNLPQSETNDNSNKLLKRCQAFPALQDARSTEDMYIDDELMANIDMHTLSENMRLIPLPSNHHEATCDKGHECCILKIQYENKCNRILLFCDDTNKTKDKKDAAYYDDEDEDLIKLAAHESLSSLNLIDLKSSSNKLSVIEEKSDEDRDTDDRDSVESEKSKFIGSSRVVQDLISLYEGDDFQKADENEYSQSILEKLRTSESEISIIILDDELEPSKKTLIPDFYDENVNSSLVEDIINV